MNIHNISRFDPALPQFFFSTDDGAGSGNGTGNNADDNAGGGNGDNGSNNGGQNSNTDSNNSETRKAEIARLVQEALDGHLGNNNGDKDATLFELTKKLHGVEKQRDDARAGALSSNDRKAFEAFKALNLSPDDLKNIVGEYGSMKTERDNNAKLDGLKKAAGVAGINADLLASLGGALDVEYVVTGEGDAATATVKAKDASGAEVVKPLGDWAKEKWPALENALLADAAQGARTVTTYGKSAPANGGKKQDVWDRVRDEKKPKTENATQPSWQEQVGLRR